MKIISTNVFVGPNLYAHFPVIRHVIDLGALEEWPTKKLGDPFIQGLLRALPGLNEHGCSYGEPGGFVRRMNEDQGTWLGHVLEHVAIELQNVAGSDVTFGKTRSTSKKGEYNMVFAYKQRDVGLEASRIGRELIFSLLPEKLKAKLAGEFDPEFDFREERDSFIEYAQTRELGPSTASLVKAAAERDVPFLRLNRYSLVQLGHGKYQRRIQATVTSETRHIGVEIASDKEDTRNLLSDLGLPVPAQALVYNDKAAIREANKIGYPVVVKPLNANHGRGVSINLTDDEQLKTAFANALDVGTSRAIIIESYIPGFDHRMLVVNGELTAVAKRVPGHVVGDGAKTVEELVEEVNADPRRGIGHEKVLTKIKFDHQANRLLSQKGYSQDTVLEKDEILYLRSTANLSTGGTAVDMLDVVHPDNRDMAVRAAKAVGLDVCGVDFLTEDITSSYKEIGGAICEVNAAPGFRMHVAPSEGKPRDVAGPVMDMLFPPGTPSRIPIASITGTNGKTTTSRMLAHILKTAGHVVGLTSSDGVYIDGHLTVKGDMTGPTSARMVLRDPFVDIAVMETARGGLIRSGMGYRKCDVAACMNVTADHLGLRGIDTLEQLAEVKRIIIEVAQDCAVLNADDPLCLKMADHTNARHLCYVTMNPDHSLVREHIRSEGRAVVLERGINGEMITIYDNGAHIPLIWTHLIPATLEGIVTHNVQNAMFASALAYSLGKSLEDIRHGLRTYTTTFFQSPGRMNIFEGHPFKVILDYAHNPAAMEAMCHAVDRMDVKGRRICVLSCPGDRRDEDVAEISKISAAHFDHFICKADDNLRNRGPDEIPQMLRAALQSSGVDEKSIEVIPDEFQAVDRALSLSEPDDLLVIFGDEITRCWKQIINFDPQAEPRAKQSEADKPVIGNVQSEEFVLDDSQRLIRDERGVRLAKEEAD